MTTVPERMALLGVSLFALAGLGALHPPERPVQTPAFRSDAWSLPDEVLLGFVEVPGGPFSMGGDPTTDPMALANERWSETSARGTVDVPTFYMGRYEVTVGQFRAFVQATGYPLVDAQAFRGPADHPMASVSWPDALAYARWLEARLRAWPETPTLLGDLLREGWRVSLPSEAEWEKAARGPRGSIFPWGDEARSDRGNVRGRGTTPVGAFACPECAYGLADMSGNVWEWTRSPYQPYPYTAADDRRDLESEALWVMRGGSFGDAEPFLRAATRGAADPGARRAFIGFRLVVYRPEAQPSP